MPVETVNRDAAEVAAEVKRSIAGLIEKHQYKPDEWWSALFNALKQRVYR